VIDTTFRRVRSLQPDVNDEYFDDGPQTVTEPQILNDLRLAITCWEPPRNQFSAFFLDEFTVDSVVRRIVTAALVKIQKVRCRIEHMAIPYDGGELFSQQLPRNLHELPEARIELDFPQRAIEERKQLKAGEFLSICDDCSGSGATECPKCSGAGTKICDSCVGSGMEECRTCNGTGEVLESATTTRSCTVCSGKRTQNCRSCRGRGHHRCDAVGCKKGNLECATCGSSGKLRNTTYLHIETFVKVKHHLHCKDGWVDPGSELATDLMILRSEKSFNTARNVKPEMLRSLFPENLRLDAIRISREVAEEKADDSWDLGIRYELRAGYVYHVFANHLHSNTELVVSGCSNSVTVLVPPDQPKGLFKKLGRKISTLLSGDQVRNSAHVDAVRAGEAFLSDSALIGPSLRKQGLEVSLNPDGYDVVVPDFLEDSNHATVSFRFDASGNITLHCSVLLGDADRDCFPEALMLSNKLPIGNIALQELNGGNIEHFVIVNLQPYVTTSPPHLAYLLRLMLSTAFQLRKSNRIGLSL
jgi:hypothetical protein